MTKDLPVSHAETLAGKAFTNTYCSPRYFFKSDQIAICLVPYGL